MSKPTAVVQALSVPSPKRLVFFKRYLTAWVFLCMLAGVEIGRLVPDLTAALRKLEFGRVIALRT